MCVYTMMELALGKEIGTLLFSMARLEAGIP